MQRHTRYTLAQLPHQYKIVVHMYEKRTDKGVTEQDPKWATCAQLYYKMSGDFYSHLALKLSLYQ